MRDSLNCKISIDKSTNFSYYRFIGLVITLAGLSIYKPYALYQTLSLGQTIINILMNIVVANLTGAAIYIHNLF